jgi:hypothetical protein
MTGGAMLTEVQVYYKTDVIKKTMLTYSGGALPVLISAQDFFGASNATTPSYDFTYYIDGLNGSNYSRDSYGIDHWGYNNSAPAAAGWPGSLRFPVHPHSKTRSGLWTAKRIDWLCSTAHDRARPSNAARQGAS